MSEYNVIIIGAGASGLIAAETAGRNNKKVLLLEKMEQAGRKLRITGKGRCNLTNISSIGDFLKHVGSDSRFLRNAFSVFFVDELMNYFKSIGLALKVERGNRVFPESDKAQDVFMALVKQIEKNPNITIQKKSSVKEILQKDGCAVGVKLQDGTTIEAEKVILATGGESYPSTGSTGYGYVMARNLGHTVEKTFPALVPLICKESIASSAVDFTLKNVGLSAFESENNKKVVDLFGEMKFHRDGIGGPLVLTLSRYLTKGLHEGREFIVKIDLKPALKPEDLDKEIVRLLNENGGTIFPELARKWLPEQLIQLMLDYTKIPKYKKSHQVTSVERKKFLSFLKSYPLTITETRGFEEAIVTQGGVSLKEINPKTMESKLVKNLYFAGEIMDLDADTGGYNLQIAFSTGYIAGMNV